MKLALDPMMVRDRPIADVIRAVAEAGYRRVEWSPREDFLPSGRGARVSLRAVRELRRIADEAGVEIASLGVFYQWSSPDADIRAASVRYFRSAVEIASELGCPQINTELKGDAGLPEPCEAAFWRSLDEILPVLEERRVRVVVEPHPYDFIESNDRAVDLVRGIDSEWVGYLFCAPHVFNMGADLGDMIAYAGGTIGYVHLADSFKRGRYIVNPATAAVRVHQHLDVGLGDVDWHTLFGALRQIDYAGVLSVGVFAHKDRPMESFRANFDAVHRIAAGLGIELD
jgi:myo-inositol catabolism protein IolH